MRDFKGLAAMKRLLETHHYSHEDMNILGNGSAFNVKLRVLIMPSHPYFSRKLGLHAHFVINWQNNSWVLRRAWLWISDDAGFKWPAFTGGTHPRVRELSSSSPHFKKPKELLEALERNVAVAAALDTLVWEG